MRLSQGRAGGGAKKVSTCGAPIADHSTLSNSLFVRRLSADASSERSDVGKLRGLSDSERTFLQSL
jgi:hypothetical protein